MRYSFNDNILTIVGSKKMFGKIEMFDIPFSVEDIDRGEIEEFLGELME